VSLTLDTYSQVLAGLQAEAAKRIEDAIGCQIGCQGEDDGPSVPEEAADSLGKVVNRTFTSWKQMAAAWLRQIEGSDEPLEPAFGQGRWSSVRAFSGPRDGERGCR